MSDRQAWERLPRESSKAYAAFCLYYQQPLRTRSIDEAYRIHRRAQGTQEDIEGRAPASWFRWSRTYDWVARATAHDERLAEQDRLLWEERRRDLKERDWQQADEMREIVQQAFPHAQGFIQRQISREQHGTPTVVDADGNVIRQGTPTRQLITAVFNIDALARVLTAASRMQRLTVNEPTDIISELTGAALDSFIQRQLAELADEREATTGAPHSATSDGDTEPTG